eukprot:CAMPEP_0172458100 /NCGR_PEP_ID=MMETSP1065-20121228/25782_1 /TAXON_ID=265537 /ORGANISM="Amphiprora paludosa, Strain CCMP125" /LENGTH=63 /DNA_ID=CAMNT_0013212183 /DNA_START=61 /DNA_END=248 /DNA_ORIENTATION=-
MMRISVSTCWALLVASLVAHTSSAFSMVGAGRSTAASTTLWQAADSDAAEEMSAVDMGNVGFV